MKQIRILFVPLMVALFSPATNSYAFSPQKPFLITNKNENLCRPLVRAWQGAFESAGEINTTSAHLEEHYDAAELIKFPPDKPSSLYGKGYFFQADMDKDGKIETFYLKSDEVGWRYLGVDLYKVTDIENLERELAISLTDEISREIQNKISPSSSEIDPPLQKYFKHIYRYRPGSQVHLLKHTDGLYTFSIPQPPADQSHSSVALIKLGETESSVICEAALLPAKNKYREFTDTSEAFRLLKDIYGAPGHECMGTLGWRAAPLDYSLSNIFERPHALPHGKNDHWQNSATATKLRYISWAVSDPVSWQTLLSIENSKPDFIQYLKKYYISHFSFDKKSAELTAEIAWKYWLDNIIYARSPDGYSLTIAAKSFEASTSDDLGNIIQQAYEHIEAGDYPPNVHIDALLALIYTSADRGKIQSAYENVKTVAGSEYKNTLNKALLASIGNTNLMQMSLDYGADVNAETNWFKKTPLMYAVQMNDHESTKFLIQHGASINAKTDGRDYYCDELERDHRTSLMYAAENADHHLLEFLIGSGADTAATDSQGHGADWYLGKNPMITDKKESIEIIKDLSAEQAP